ncbi:FecR family protein [Mesorhizobium amorphae]|nr:FecR domain-containing protein [Mesorhizobium amorphae]
MAAEAVGQAVVIKTAVTGATGPLVVRAPVHQDERIRTSNTGLGQFVFLDGTKLAVGWGSSVVIDKYVFDNENSVKKLTIRAAKGTFRWISGSSPSSAYQIVTPAGTIGVRGTAFDVHVAPNGKTAVVLLKGSARFCGGGGCRELKRRCDCVVATPSGAMSDVTKVNRSVLAALGTSRALPFLTGNQKLSGGLDGIGGNCGLAAAIQQEHEARPQQRNSPAPSPPSPGTPDPPSPPDPPTPGVTDDGNNGHGNDPGKHDPSNPGKSNGPRHG